MAVVVISRWKGPPDPGLAKEAAPIFKRHGAVGVRLGYCHAGPYAGQIYTAITFPDFAAYGAGMQAVLADPDYQRLLTHIQSVFELQERSVLMVEEL